MTLHLMAIVIERWLAEQPDASLVALAHEVADLGRSQFTAEN